MREIDYREECPKTHTKNKIQFITRKQKHQLEGNVVPAGYSHTNAHYAGGVNLNSNHTKYLAQTLRPIFLRFGIFPLQICESCGATYRQNYEMMFSAL